MADKSRILIADDNLPNSELLEAYLSDLDCEIAMAADGLETLNQVKAFQPDLILLDVMMPGMTGFEVCQQLRADPRLNDTPIILLTALEDAGVGTMGKKAGATTTLRKPFGPEYIIEFLGKVLRRKSGPLRL